MINIYTREDYKKSFTELCYLLEYFSDNELDKIPNEEIEYYYYNRDTTYEFECDANEDIENLPIMHLTKILLANIYEKYLASEEEKQKLKRRREEFYKKEEEKKKEKYNTDIFKNINKNENKYESMEMIVIKEGLFTKLLKKLKKLLKMN